MRNGPKRKKAANIKKNHWIVLFLFPFHIHPHFPDRSLYLCSLLFFLAMCHTKFTKKEWKSSLCVNKFLWWIVWYRRVGARRKRKIALISSIFIDGCSSEVRSEDNKFYPMRLFLSHTLLLHFPLSFTREWVSGGGSYVKRS